MGKFSKQRQQCSLAVVVVGGLEPRRSPCPTEELDGVDAVGVVSCALAVVSFKALGFESISVATVVLGYPCHASVPFLSSGRGLRCRFLEDFDHSQSLVPTLSTCLSKFEHPSPPHRHAHQPCQPNHVHNMAALPLHRSMLHQCTHHHHDRRVR